MRLHLMRRHRANRDAVGSSTGTSRRRAAGTSVGTVLALLTASAAWALGAAPQASALSNGLALTPPMGWNSWNKFGCNVTEQKVESVADDMVSSGMAAAGYTYVDIDDCWMAASARRRRPPRPGPREVPRRDQRHRRVRALQGPEAGHLRERGHRDLRRLPRQPRPRADRRQQFRLLGCRPAQVRQLLPDDGTCPGSSSRRTDHARRARQRRGRQILFSLCEWGVDSVWTWGAGVGNMLADHR